MMVDDVDDMIDLLSLLYSILYSTDTHMHTRIYYCTVHKGISVRYQSQ